MSDPVPLRSDFDAALLRKLARRSDDPDQTRRLLALAEIYEGCSRSTTARSRINYKSQQRYLLNIVEASNADNQ
jgi:hypothetical protein